MDTREIERKVIEAQIRRGDAAALLVARQISANAPRGLTNRLSQAPTVRRDVEDRSIRWTIGIDVKSPEGYPYDVAQEEGTGVYVGKGRITPKRAKMLRFYWRKVGHWVAFKSVKGTPPTRFFSKAIRDWPTRLRESGDR